MELKEYQKKTLDQVKIYLDSLAEYRGKYEKLIADDPDLAIDFPFKAWEKACPELVSGSISYHSSRNGLGEPLPDFYLKIPTGGGKTILACHAIDLISRIYLKKQTGIVLWIVPTTQIYRQTLTHLRNREHPYRHVLDISSGGRTLILEKLDKFTPLDIEENLVIMLLMLPSASRQNKETLKVFKDSGGFTEFFPSEDAIEDHKELLEKFPNLDFFGREDDFFGRMAKTSLGNTLRVLNPVIIIDEGHKAYSETARNTIRGFNPAIIVELSATPPKNTNLLVNISGQALNREEMIKLDLNVINKSSPDWKDVMLASKEKRDYLERKAKEYEANTGEYIRPICLVQAERTGKEQRGTKYIHAEDVKEYLIKQCGVSENEIAIKSSEKDDIEGIDLLSRDCEIRYIITKQALQEGWDCAFAYILTILTNPGSQLSITQLVGRILRQPKARKTKVKDLDESYVFCHRPKAGVLLESIKQGFEVEGLGDLASRVTVKEGDPALEDASKEKTVRYRDKFKVFEGKVYLPKFVIQENGGWRNVNYDMDILSRIDWSDANLDSVKVLPLGEKKIEDEEIRIGLSEDVKELLERKSSVERHGGLKLDHVLMTRQLLDIVPNPWIAHDIGKEVLDALLKKNSKEKVTNNLAFIIEETRKHLIAERDRLSEKIFRDLIDKKRLWFFLLADKGGYELPPSIKVKKSSRRLIRDDHSEVQRSLFDYVPEGEFNEMEKSIAIYLDEQEKLLWWYRNLSRQDYYIQGWRKNKIYPDFIFTKADDTGRNFNTVYVVETKGIHLKDFEDTKYKRNVFKFCNELGQKREWKELNREFSRGVEFQVIAEDEWKKKINEIFMI
ncbi:MAG: DEAD/DEAH box helicase family protein [Nitrospirota bacterium]